jgi:hypothetical protein
MLPSSRFAVALKPNVAYLSLNSRPQRAGQERPRAELQCGHRRVRPGRARAAVPRSRPGCPWPARTRTRVRRRSPGQRQRAEHCATAPANHAPPSRSHATRRPATESSTTQPRELGRRSPCSRQRPCRDDGAGHRRAHRRQNAQPQRARRQHPRSPPVQQPVPRASRSGSSAAATSESRVRGQQAGSPCQSRRHPGSASARRVHRPLLSQQQPSPRTELQRPVPLRRAPIGQVCVPETAKGLSAGLRPRR